METPLKPSAGFLDGDAWAVGALLWSNETSCKVRPYSRIVRISLYLTCTIVYQLY